MRKSAYACFAKVQMSLHIRTVWSAPLLFAVYDSTLK